jgi:hypothetical protein
MACLALPTKCWDNRVGRGLRKAGFSKSTNSVVRRDEIDAAFKKLREELDANIQARIEATRRALLDHFDEDVHARLRVELDTAREQLDRVGRLFWSLTKYILRECATFDEPNLTFLLNATPTPGLAHRTYHLISKSQSNISGEFLYRLSHPLGEHVIETGKQCRTPVATVTFDMNTHPTYIATVEALKGKQGWLLLRQRLFVDSFERPAAYNDADESIEMWIQ